MGWMVVGLFSSIICGKRIVSPLDYGHLYASMDSESIKQDIVPAEERK
jgi:hypothetical protein